jgi:hypothetical protein
MKASGVPHDDRAQVLVAAVSHERVRRVKRRSIHSRPVPSASNAGTARQPVDKQIVRALAALSGAQYSQCLVALHVLAPLRRHLDLGDLAAVVSGSSERRPIGVRVHDADRSLLHTVFEISSGASGDAWLVDRHPVSETRLLLPLCTQRDVYYDHPLEGHLLPRGAWRVDRDEVRTALGHLVPRGADGASTMVVRAELGTLCAPPDSALGLAPAPDEVPPAVVRTAVTTMEATSSVEGLVRRTDGPRPWCAIAMNFGGWLWWRPLRRR